MGSILSKVDSRQVTKDNNKSSAGVRAKRETLRIAKTVTKQVSAREGAAEVSALIA